MGAIDNFLKNALKDFSHIAALFPSTSFAARSVVRQIPADAKVVVEYGPGDGIITKVLLRKLAADCRVVCIEVNDNFVSQLKQMGDQRLEVIKGDVVAMSGELRKRFPDGVDAVISGIPFSFLRAEKGETVIKNTKAALRQGGCFVLYQNSLRTLGMLKKHFPKVKFSFEPRNVFPYFIIVATT